MSGMIADRDLETPGNLAAGKDRGGDRGRAILRHFCEIAARRSELVAAAGARIEHLEETGVFWHPRASLQADRETAIRAASCVRPGRWRISGRRSPIRWRRSPAICSSCAEVSARRLIDIHFPGLRERLSGPGLRRRGHAQAGWRRAAGPLIGTIVKPSVGLFACRIPAALALQLAQGGIDFIKDDELQGNGPHCPLAERVKAVMAAFNDDAEKTGKKVMYAFNITGEVDEMKRSADLGHSP